MWWLVAIGAGCSAGPDPVRRDRIGATVLRARPIAAGGTSAPLRRPSRAIAPSTLRAPERVASVRAVESGPVLDLASGFAGPTIERSQCVTVALRPAVAYECGALRVAYPLPTLTTVSEARTPTLVYRSDHAAPRPIVRVGVTLPAGTTGTVTASIRVHGLQGATWSWPASDFPAGQRREIGLPFDADGNGLTTGLYPLTVFVTANGQTAQAHGELPVVNRRQSPFGPGWWLAGYEQLVAIAGSADYFWVGGDGSTRRYRYRSTTGGTQVFVSEGAVDAVDTLTVAPDGWRRRHLGDGAHVAFDPGNRHVRTVDAAGHQTHFTPGFCGRLGQVWVPTPGGAGPHDWSGTRWWSFNYSTDYTPDPCGPTHLTSVAAAHPVASEYRWTWLETRPEFTSIFDPARGQHVIIGYDPASGRASGYRDRAGTWSQLEYGSDGLLVRARTPDGATEPTWRFDAAEGRAVRYGPLDDGSAGVTTLVDPRAHPTWITVTALGAPRRIENALHQVTTLDYADPRFPGLVTRVARPNGYSTHASYDARGNATVLRADPVPGLVETPAVTTIQYHPVWNLPVRTTSPMGVVETRQYRSDLPLLTAVRPGDDPARETRFTYCEGPDGCPRGLLRTVERPVATAPPPPPPSCEETGTCPPPPPGWECPIEQPNCQPMRAPLGGATGLSAGTPCEDIPLGPGVLQRFAYDAVGNLRCARTAGGKERRYGRDRLGRVTHDSTRVTDGASGATWRVTTNTHDFADRVVAARTDAPRLGGGVQTLHVATDYDAEDRPTRVRRWDPANPTGVGELVDSMVYDPLGRMVRRRVPGYGAAYDSTVYDLAGNVVATRSRRGLWVRMDYDALNRLTQRITDPVAYPSRTDLGLSRYTAGGLVEPYPSTQWPLGSTSPTTLDGDTASFTYDPVHGGIATASNRDARISRSYWLNGLLQREEQRIRTIDGQDFGTHLFAIETAYDPDGRRTQVTTPAGPYRYGYDPQTGEVRWLRNPLGDSVHVAYDSLGHPATLRLPGGVLRTLTYTLDGELQRDRLQVPTTAARPLPHVSGIVRDAQLTYTVDGKLTALRGAGVVQDTLLLRYTPLGHFAQSRYRGRDMNDFGNVVVNASVDSVLFDALGNQLSGRDSTRRAVAGGASASSQPKAWQYRTDGSGRLDASSVGFDVTDYHYDAAGNMEAAIRQESDGSGGRPALGGRDRVMFYDARDQLRVVETREAAAPPQRFEGNDYLFQSEEYRYDALGRRVLVHSRRQAGWRSRWVPTAARAFVRRTVWDGDREVYEAQAPAAVGTRELNGLIPYQPLLTVAQYDPGTPVDPNPHFGQVGYGYLGGGVDQPVTVERFHYADRNVVLFPYSVSPLWRAPAHTVFPSWNAQGRADLGTVRDGGRQFCVGSGGSQRCTTSLEWAGYWTPYAAGFQPLRGWTGSLLEDKRDPTGLLYRRNRYVDPAAARFTQEDPIGLAGGLNAYNYADGDPVTYADPFGLCPCLAALGAAAEAAAIRTAVVAAAARVAASPAGQRIAERGGALARNLAASGVVRGAGEAAHHIVAKAAERAAPARDALQRVGVGINEAVNGVILPATRDYVGKAANHLSLHTKAYYDAVNQALANVQTRQQAEEALKRISEKLRNGGFP